MYLFHKNVQSIVPKKLPLCQLMYTTLSSISKLFFVIFHFIIVFLQYIFLLFCLISVVLACFYFGSVLYIYIKTKGGPGAPYIPLAHTAINSLIKLVQVEDHHVIYDLGCGDARIIRALSRVHKRGHYKGVERNLFVYLLARLCTLFFSLRNPGRDVRIVYGDIFKQDLHNATHVITYLFPEVMNALLPKLKKELKPGTLLYSIDFMFKGKSPKEVISMSSQKWKLGQNVYVYEF